MVTKFEMTSKGDWDKFCEWRLEVQWMQLNQVGIWNKDLEPPQLVNWKVQFITPAGNAVEVTHPNFIRKEG